MQWSDYFDDKLPLAWKPDVTMADAHDLEWLDQVAAQARRQLADELTARLQQHKQKLH